MVDNHSSSSESPSASGELGIDDVVRFLRSAWKFGFAAAVLVGGIAAGLLLTQPRQWESSASLLVSTPSFRNDAKDGKTEAASKNDGLSLMAYQRILESAAVVNATRVKLRAAGVLGSDEPLEVGAALESRVLTAKRSEEAILAPLIELKVRAKSPETAVAIVDSWIACFFEHTKNLTSGNSAAIAALVENQYQEHSKRLGDIEDRRLKAAAGFQKQLADLQEEWNTRLATCRAESGELLTTHQNETATLLVKARSEQQISQRQAEIDGLSKALADIQNQLAMSAVFKAMGSERPEQNSGALSLAFSNLRDQERQLTERLATAKNALGSDLLAIGTLERTRENALATLKDQRAALLNNLTTRQKAAIDALRREESSQLNRLDQELASAREIFGKLTRDFGQAQLAKAQQSVLDVRVASAAVKPEIPLPRGAANKAIMAAILGAMGGFALVLLRNINRRIDGKTP